jgi:ABC-type multidrug transport system fused ATPase/permease subunit
MITAGLLSAVAVGMSFPGLALVFGEMLNAFLCFATQLDPDSCISRNSTCGSNFQDEIVTASIRFAIIGFGAWAASYLYVMLLIWTAERQTRQMRENFFCSIMRQEMSWFDTSDPGELATRMTE